MGEWKYLHVQVAWDTLRNADKVVSVDDPVAGAEIFARLSNPAEPKLSDFLQEAGKQEWQMVASDENEVVLKRYNPA